MRNGNEENECTSVAERRNTKEESSKPEGEGNEDAERSEATRKREMKGQPHVYAEGTLFLKPLRLELSAAK